MKTIFKWSFLTVLLLLAPLVYGQSINLKLTDGSSSSFAIDDLVSITFSNDNLLFRKSEGTVSYFSIIKSQQLYFDLTTLIERSAENAISLEIYPNPANDFIYVKQLSLQTGEAKIYSLMGELVSVVELKTLITTIDISQLSTGIYFLSFNNQTQKFIKQ